MTDSGKRSEHFNKRSLARSDDDSDDDYLDRTGQAAKKKERMKIRARKLTGQQEGLAVPQKAETFTSLREKLISVDQEMEQVNLSMLQWEAQHGKAIVQQSKEGEGEDDLDAFMYRVDSDLTQEGAGKFEKTMESLKEKRKQLLRLIAIIDPKWDPATLHNAPITSADHPNLPIISATIHNKPIKNTTTPDLPIKNTTTPDLPIKSTIPDDMPINSVVIESKSLSSEPSREPIKEAAVNKDEMLVDESNPSTTSNSGEPISQHKDRGIKRKGRGAGEPDKKRVYGAMTQDQSLTEAIEEWVPPT
eukprot:Ihof_evm2s630 gene=Ihof_evmTU2s630